PVGWSYFPQGSGFRRFYRLDVGLGLALVLDQGDEVVALGIPGLQVVTGLLEEAEEPLEVVDAQAAVGLDQLVQGRRGIVGRLNVQEKTDRVVADLFANDLLLVFTHHVLQLAAVHTGPAVYSPPVRGSTQLKR